MPTIYRFTFHQCTVISMVPFDSVAITSIARSGSTATALVVSTSGITTGYLAYIYGFDQDEYNGSKILTVVDATHFSFPVTGTPTTPGTGSGFYRLAASPYVPLLGGPLVLPPAAYHSAQLEDSAVLKVNAGRLTSFYGTNQDTAGCWIMLFDATSLPANGTLPKCVIAAGQTDNFFIDVPDNGIRFDTGIVAASSSTGDTLTVRTNDKTHFDAAFHD